jgi:hypothetical protein
MRLKRQSKEYNMRRATMRIVRYLKRGKTDDLLRWTTVKEGSGGYDYS